MASCVRTQSRMALAQSGVCHRPVSKAVLVEEKQSQYQLQRTGKLSPTPHFSSKLFGIIRYDFPVAFKDFYFS